jgi:hypothetical protein
MSISLGVVGDFVNASADDARLPGMVAQAQALLVSEFNEQAVDTVLWDWATVQTVGELWKRATSNGALVQYGPDGQQSFLSSDVLAPVRPQLKRYKRLGAVG